MDVVTYNHGAKWWENIYNMRWVVASILIKTTIEER